jgi:hypothetical protein
MDWMTQVGDLLKRYTGGPTSSPPPSAQEDFAKVAQTAPPSVLSSGLADAFRSEHTPEFSEMVGTMFAKSDGTQRAGILSHLLEAAGPSALSAGSLGSLSGLLSGGRASVTPEQAQNVSPDAIKQLAARAETANPSVIDKAGEFYAQHPKLVQGLGAGVLAVVIRHLSQRH